MAKHGGQTKFKPDTIEKIEWYLKNYDKNGDVIPTIAGLCLHLGVVKQTIYNWAKDEEKRGLLDLLEWIKYTQETKVINGGLKGDYNSAVSKLILFKHGYHEKEDEPAEKAININITGHNGEQSPFNTDATADGVHNDEG